MPQQTTKSSLAAKYGSRLNETVKKHSTDQTRWGFRQIPAGVDNGVAELVECKFEQYQAGTNMRKANGASAAGEFYFMARGVALEPDYVTDENGRELPVAGEQTSIMVNCFDHKRSDGSVVTQDECFDQIMNHLRMLGGDTSTVESVADLEALAEALKDQQPPVRFRFSTRKGKPTQVYPNPRTFETWHGIKGMEDYVPPAETAAGTYDNSPGAATAGHSEGPSDNGKHDDPAANIDGGDIDSLLERANNKDTAAQKQLTSMAIAAGADPQAVEETKTWEEVVELINSASGSAGETQEEPEQAAAAVEPKKGDVFRYQLVNPKTGEPAVDARTRKAKPPVDCEVTAAYKKNGTVDLLLLSDRKTVYKGVKIEQLIPIS